MRVYIHTPAAGESGTQILPRLLLVGGKAPNPQISPGGAGCAFLRNAFTDEAHNCKGQASCYLQLAAPDLLQRPRDFRRCHNVSEIAALGCDIEKELRILAQGQAHLIAFLTVTAIHEGMPGKPGQRDRRDRAERGHARIRGNPGLQLFLCPSARLVYAKGNDIAVVGSFNFHASSMPCLV